LYERAPKYFAYMLAVTALRSGRVSETIEAAKFRDTSVKWNKEWQGWYTVPGAAYQLLGKHKEELSLALERRHFDPLVLAGLDQEIAARAAMNQRDEILGL